MSIKLLPKSTPNLSPPSDRGGQFVSLKMKHMEREQRKKVNVTWLICAISLIGIVLIGFTFLLRNFIGHWPNVPNPFHKSFEQSDDQVPISPFLGNGHTYDTAIPKERGFVAQREEEQEIITKPSTIEERNRDVLFSENERVKLNVVRRSQWGAREAKRTIPFNVFAISKAIVLETGTDLCYNQEHCSQSVRMLQKNDLKLNMEDIRYNFLVGGDGSIFEGRGFNGIGNHTPSHNSDSLGIALIGKFDQTPPSEAQVISLRKLLQFGIAWEHLKSNYELFGHDQLLPDMPASRPSNASSNPGEKLFEIIRKWPHWTSNNYYKTYN